MGLGSREWEVVQAVALGSGWRRDRVGAQACAPSLGTSKREKQFQAHRAFGDRRDGVVSARTYFYANEARCDSHMETFLRCIEASGGAPLVSGPHPPGPAWAEPQHMESLEGECEVG